MSSLRKEGTHKEELLSFQTRQRKGKERYDDRGDKDYSKAIVKIEEINAVSDDGEDGDVLLTSKLECAQLVITDDLILHDWILDSGASFHVTPHRKWFTTYDEKRTGRVSLGNNYACEIVGVGDVQLKF